MSDDILRSLPVPSLTVYYVAELVMTSVRSLISHSRLVFMTPCRAHVLLFGVWSLMTIVEWLCVNSELSKA